MGRRGKWVKNWGEKIMPNQWISVLSEILKTGLDRLVLLVELRTSPIWKKKMPKTGENQSKTGQNRKNRESKANMVLPRSSF